jgi:hypothetical protein
LIFKQAVVQLEGLAETTEDDKEHLSPIALMPSTALSEKTLYSIFG